MSIFSDNFTGTGALSAHTSDSGHTWTPTDSPSAANEMHLASGVAALDGVDPANETSYYSNLAPPSPNYTVTGRIRVTDGTQPVYPSIRARVDHTTNNGYRVFFQIVTKDLVLRKDVGGVATDLQTTNIGVGLGPGDFLDVKLDLAGSTLQVSYSINGTSFASASPVTDTDISATGTVGLASYNNVSAAVYQGFDILTVDAGAASADYTTAANGNFNTGATWVGGVVPPSGAGHTLQINHVVSLDINWDGGQSSSTDSTPAISIAASAKLTINDGKTLTCRGSIICADGGLTLGISGGAGGATLTFDASANGSPTARHYFLQLGTAHNQTNARLVSNGVSGTPNTIQTAVGSGAAFITAGGFLRGGLGTCVFTNFTRLGTSSQTAWDFWASSDSDTMDVQDSTFDTCGAVETSSGYAGGAFIRFARTIFKNGVASIALQLQSLGAITVGTRIVDDCRMDTGFNHWSADLTVKNTFVIGQYTPLSNANATAATWFNNMLYNAVGLTQTMPGGTKKDFAVICDQPSNPHWVQEQADVSGVIDGAVYECPNIPSDGDATAIPSCSVDTTYALYRSILVANALGACPGNILNALTNVHGTITNVEHNSFITDNNGASGGINCGETYLGRAGLFGSIKSNLAVGSPGHTDGTLLQRITGSSVQDMCAPANCDYNGLDNIETGTDGGGVNAQSGPTFFSTPGTHGTHDVSGPSGLLDITVGLTKWDWSLAGTISKAVTGITRSGATVTVNRTAHGYRVGEWVTIAGASQTEYNGTFRVTAVVDANNFTVTVTGTPATPATGTITITQEGTVAHALAGLLNRSTNYTVANYIAYVREGWTPTAVRYKGTAHDGGDIGAVVVGGGAPPPLHCLGGGYSSGYTGGYLN